MKNAVMVVISAILGVIMLAVVMTMYGRMNRSMEQQNALPACMEETVENTAESYVYEPGNTDEYIADVIEALSVQLETDSDITITVMKADKEKGVLSLGLTETFLYPNGKTGILDSERTVLLNRKEGEALKKYQVRFFIGDVCYKAYKVYEGDTVLAPKVPDSDGRRFAGWKDSNAYLADFTQPIMQNTDYFADWE